MMLKLQPETMQEMAKVPKGTVAFQSMTCGLLAAEPLIICMDGMLRYAKAHKARFESPLSEDYVLGPLWLETVKGLRGLLNGDGAVAHELGISTDSKDNGVLEGTFWRAMDAAGFTEKDI